MRCYYPYVNYVPTSVPRPDQLGRLKSCANSDPIYGVYPLSSVLSAGNSAGNNGILMNGQDITGASLVETISLNTNILGTVSLTSNSIETVNLNTNGLDTIDLNTTNLITTNLTTNGLNTDSIAFNGGSSGVSIIQLSGAILSYLAGANSSSHEFITTSNAGVTSVPVTISSSSTEITNNTTINNLLSTTQPAGTNNTSVATTAFVQNAISSAKIQSIQVYANNLQTTFNSFGFMVQNPTTSDQNDYFTMRVSVSMPWQKTSGNYMQCANYDGIIDIRPNWLQSTGILQSSFTQFCINPNASPQPGLDLGFDPIGNRYYAINNGTVNNSFSPPRWLTVSGLSGQIGNNSTYDLTSGFAPYTYSSVPATWIQNRWAWSHPSFSSGSMMYSSVIGSNTIPYFQILPTYVAGQGIFVQFMFYNPPAVSTSGWQPNTGSYFDCSCTVEIIDKGLFTLGSFTDFGTISGVSQWNTIINNM